MAVRLCPGAAPLPPEGADDVLAAQHGSEPDTGFVAETDRPDDICTGRDEVAALDVEGLVELETQRAGQVPPALWQRERRDIEADPGARGVGRDLEGPVTGPARDLVAPLRQVRGGEPFEAFAPDVVLMNGIAGAISRQVWASTPVDSNREVVTSTG